jgi:hypothetical protein
MLPREWSSRIPFNHEVVASSRESTKGMVELMGKNAQDGSNTRLRQPIGRWTEEVQQNECCTLCDVSHDRVEAYVLRDGGNYNLFRNTQPTKGRQYYVHGQPYRQVDSIPLSAISALLGRHRGNGLRSVMFRTRKEANGLRAIMSPKTFDEYVSSQEAHIQQIVGHSDQSEDTADKVAEQLYCAKHIMAGTDGGLLNGDGTFGYVLQRWKWVVLNIISTSYHVVAHIMSTP